MSNAQLFLALVGVIVTVIGAQTLLLNARISDVKEQVNQLIQYMVSHEGRISALEERNKKAS
jgi:hypothetical protein